MSKRRPVRTFACSGPVCTDKNKTQELKNNDKNDNIKINDNSDKENDIKKEKIDTNDKEEDMISHIPSKHNVFHSIINKFGKQSLSKIHLKSKSLSNSKSKFSEWLLNNFSDTFQLSIDELKDYNVDDKHITWLVRNIISEKNLPLRISSAKFLCSLAWPDELQTDLREKIAFSGLLPFILDLGKQGYLSFHHIINEDEFEKKDFLAQGAGGTVYTGTYKEKTVAIKYCGEQFTYYTSEDEFRFEVAAMNLLNHHNIMKCLGANGKCEKPFIISPLAEKSLNDIFVNNESLRVDIKVKIALQIGDAISYLHKCKIIHRDLKPSNVLLDFQYNVVICDFGISRIHDSKRPMTLNVGTTEWIAPEIFSGDGNYTPQIDVYSFGMILYQLFTGIKPFSDVKLFNIPNFVIRGQKPTIPDDLDKPISLLIDQCIDHDPLKRPTTDIIQSKLLDYLKLVQKRPGKRNDKIFSSA